MANQQQHQNEQRPDTNREPGHTIPGQGKQDPGDQSQKQNPPEQSQKQSPQDQERRSRREEDDEIPRDPSKIPE